jgi:hypothetical protein
MGGRGNRSTRRKSAPVSLRPPQILHDFILSSNPARRFGKPATKNLISGTALWDLKYFTVGV